MIVKWNDKEKSILRMMQLQAKMSITKIAEKCNLPNYTAHALLNKLRHNKLLLSRPLINFSTLGYTEYDVYFEVSGGTAAIRKAIAEWANRTPQILEFCELGGEFDFQIVLIAKTPVEANEVMEGLHLILNDINCEKHVLTRLYHYLFGTKSLAPSKELFPILGSKNEKEVDRITPEELKLLTALHSMDEFNVRELSRKLGEPGSTIEYRLERLENKGVIVGYFYDYSWLNQSMGYLEYQLAVKLKNRSKKFHIEFFNFCHEHILVDVLRKCLGRWDYWLLVQTRTTEEVLKLVDLLYSRFPANISEIKIIQMLRVHKVNAFLPSEQSPKSTSHKNKLLSKGKDSILGTMASA